MWSIEGLLSEEFNLLVIFLRSVIVFPAAQLQDNSLRHGSTAGGIIYLIIEGKFD